jgi:hypothetical protein
MKLPTLLLTPATSRLFQSRAPQSLPFLAALCFLVFTGLSSTAEAQRQKGFVTSAPCPYSCRSQGIQKRYCKDWKEGNTCYVEDLRRAPGNSGANPPKHPTIPLNPTTPGVSPEGSASVLQQCREMRRLNPPEIYISRVKKSGNMFKNKYRVQGSIEGVCLSEAGLFHHGKKDESIRVLTSANFQRYDFEVIARADDDPEIRAYNVQGDRESVDIDPRDYGSDGYSTRDDDDDDNKDRRTGTSSSKQGAGGINILDQIFGK